MAGPHAQVTFASALLRRLFKRLALQSDRASKSTGPGPVHDLQGLHPPHASSTALKKVMDLGGNVRDLDIAVELLEKSEWQRPPPSAPSLREDESRPAALWCASSCAGVRADEFKVAAAAQAHRCRSGCVGTIEERANEILPVLAKRLFALGHRSAAGKAIQFLEPVAPSSV